MDPQRADNELVAGAPQPHGGPPADAEVFSWPRLVGAFEAFCWLLPVVVAVLASLTHVAHTDRHMLAIVALAPVLGLVAIVVLVTRITAPKAVTLSPEGIATGKRTMLWGDVSEIHKRQPRSRDLILLGNGGPGEIVLPAYPAVFRRILPAILSRRPDVAISPRARRIIANPEAATSLRAWLGLVFLAGAVGLAMGPVLARGPDMFLMAFGAICTLIPAAMKFMPLPGTIAVRFARAVVQTPVALSYWCLLQLPIHGWFGAPVFALDAMTATIAVLWLAAAVIVLGRLKLRALHVAVIFICAVGLAAVGYQRGSRAAMPATDITDLLAGDGRYSRLFWSEDGSMVAIYSADGSKGEQQQVADLTERRSVLLPLHDGDQRIVWLDRSGVYRTVWKQKGPTLLYLFRFDDNREVCLSAVRFRMDSAVRHMSADGRVFCWLAPSDNDARRALKIYDVQEKRVQEIQIDWPARMYDVQEKRAEEIQSEWRTGQLIFWQDCGWVDADTLAVRSYDLAGSREQPDPLHILWVNYRDRTVKHTVIDRGLGQWRFSPDSRHAFATEAEGEAVHWVDLRTGRTVEIGGKNLPVWSADGRSAFRTSDSSEPKLHLCRIDGETGEETTALEIAESEEFVAVSTGGRFALVQDKDRSAWGIHLVNVSTRRRRRLHLPTRLPHLDWSSRQEWRASPWLSLFSPDERTFMLGSGLSGGWCRLRLWSVPEEWLK